MKTIKVSNMACMHCVKTIDTSLKKNRIKATINLESKTVHVDDSNFDLAVEKIREAGFDAK